VSRLGARWLVVPRKFDEHPAQNCDFPGAEVFRLNTVKRRIGTYSPTNCLRSVPVVRQGPIQAPFEDDLPGRFSRIIAVWILLLATAWVLEPYVVALWSSAAGPRTVTARGDMSQAEQATVKLFQAASPSVLHVFARAEQQNSVIEDGQQGAVQSGTGIAWDSRARDHQLPRHQGDRPDRSEADVR
jgi:hypothetical protein